MALTQVTPDVVHNVQSNITQVGTLSNLTVSGNVTAGNLSISPGGTVARLNMTTTADSGLLRYASTGYRFEHNGTSLLAIADNGDLGVGSGVTNPGYRLHVVDTSGYVDAAFQSQVGSYAIVSLRNQGTHYAFWGSDNITGSAFYANSSANACIFGTTTTNNIQFVTDFKERVRILGSTGNVGINTTNPTERLHVVGNAIVTGTIIGNVSGTANNASFLGGIPAADYAQTTVYNIVDGASVDINPSFGTIQTWSLGASRSPTATSFASGKSVTLMITSNGFSITSWPSVVWVFSVPPSLAATGVNVVQLWKVDSTLYGAYVGRAA